MPRLLRKQLKQHKYGADAVTVDGIRIDSQAEARRYGELHLLERAGEITDLVIHPRFDLHVEHHKDAYAGFRIGYYEADFQYYRKGGYNVIEDVKGVRTALYKWKKRHFEAEYGMEITEIKP